MKMSSSLSDIRKILLDKGYTLLPRENKYEIWEKNVCMVSIYTQQSDRFEVTFLNIIISKRGYSRTVVITSEIEPFERMLKIVEAKKMKLSKEMLGGKTHFNF
jgi:hypothetical protein